jgi:hypothetical protein
MFPFNLWETLHRIKKRIIYAQVRTFYLNVYRIKRETFIFQKRKGPVIPQPTVESKSDFLSYRSIHTHPIVFNPF